MEEVVRRVSRVSREYNLRSHESTERGILALALRSATPQRQRKRGDTVRTECGEQEERMLGEIIADSIFGSGADLRWGHGLLVMPLSALHTKTVSMD